MAKIGANHPCFLKTGEATGVVLGKLVSANVTYNQASAELYADDSLAEQDSSITGLSIAVETDDLSINNILLIYGATEGGDGDTVFSISDTPPEGGFAFYKRGKKNGEQYFLGQFYPRVRAQRTANNAQTKGNQTAFQTESLTLTGMATDEGVYELFSPHFATETEARAWVEAKCGVTSDATLSALTLGSLTLTPSFDPSVTSYTTDTTNTTNTINATAASDSASVAILANSQTVVNGNSITWQTGANTVTVTVTNGAATKVYTITVTKS
jgi:hypothetical protein